MRNRADARTGTAIDRVDLEAQQDERLRSLLAWCRSRSNAWRDRLGDVDPRARDIRSELARVPLVTKADLREDQAAHPPLGALACEPVRAGSRFFATSGTTGVPIARLYSGDDWRHMAGFVAEALRPYVRRDDLVLVTSPTDGLLGPSVTVAAALQLGAVPVLAGRWSTETRVQFIRTAGPAVIAGATTYLLHLAAALTAQDAPFRPPRFISCIGEPGAGSPTNLAAFQRAFGSTVMIQDGYGSTEIGPAAFSCEGNPQLHLRERDFLIECLDPATAEAVPPGEPGEIVISTLALRGQPLIRYRTGDIARLSSSACPACGSVERQMLESVEGRVDEMTWYHGVNLLPGVFVSLLDEDPDVSGQFELVLDERPSLPTLTLRVETVIEVEDTMQMAAARQRLVAKINRRLGLKIDVQLLPPRTLDAFTSSGKRQRVRTIAREEPSSPIKLN